MEANKYFSTSDLELFSKYPNHHVECRGVWHMPDTLKKDGYDETTLEGVLKLLDAVKYAGFNTILIETTMSAHTVYPSKVGTIHPDFDFNDNRYGEYGNDYLMCFIKEAHKRGIQVHAWTSTMRAGRFNNTIEESMPKAMKVEWLSRGYNNEYGLDGKYGELLWMDPTNPEVEAYILAQYEELIENYPLDGIELDAIRYPISNLLSVKTGETIRDHGYTKTAYEMFSKKFNFNGDLKAEILKSMELRHDWVRFRADVMTDLVAKIREVVIKKRPKLWFSAAVLMGHENAYNIACQEWNKWIKNGWFDYVSPMAYTTNDDTVLKSFTDTQALTEDKLFNLHGIASIIEGGDYLNHFRQMKLINENNGLGSILFSIRQCIRSEATYQMVAHVYKEHPAISLFASLNDIREYILNLVNEEIVFDSELNALKNLDLVNKGDVLKALDIVRKLINNSNGEVKHCLEVLMKVLYTRSLREI